MSKYSPLTQLELEAIGFLEGFEVPTWNGPALPRPVGLEGLEEVIDNGEYKTIYEKWFNKPPSPEIFRAKEHEPT